jgi:hypothetical protein
VPQEENSPSMYIAQIMHESQRGIYSKNIILVVTLSDNQHPEAQWLHCNATTSYHTTYSLLESFSHVYTCDGIIRVITGVYFSAG